MDLIKNNNKNFKCKISYPKNPRIPSCIQITAFSCYRGDRHIESAILNSQNGNRRTKSDGD